MLRYRQTSPFTLLRSTAWLLFLSLRNGESFMVTASVPWSRDSTGKKQHGKVPSFVARQKPITPVSLSDTRQQTVNTTSPQNETQDRSKIEVSSEIELPFSSDVAFDAFADVRRQPAFSNWLKSVEYLEGSATNSVGTKSKWTISVFGFGFSWKAVSLRQDRNAGVIEWGSLSGLKNQGLVQFSPSLNGDKSNTHMKLTMTIFIPRFVARMMGSSNKSVAGMIEKRMLQGTLERFREDVLRNDLRSPLIDFLGDESSLEEVSYESLDKSSEVLCVKDVERDLVDGRGSGFRPVVPQD